MAHTELPTSFVPLLYTSVCLDLNQPSHIKQKDGSSVQEQMRAGGLLPFQITSSITRKAAMLCPVFTAPHYGLPTGHFNNQNLNGIKGRAAITKRTA